MIRRTTVGFLLSIGLCGSAIAAESPEIFTPEVTPISRASTSAFDLLSPAIKARSAYENGQFNESFKNYSAVYLHDQDNVEILLGVARSALAIGKNDIAVKAYKRASQYELKSEQAFEQFTGLVLAEIAAGISEHPETRLKQALKITPDDFRLWNSLGQFYDKKSQWRKSKEAYKKAHLTGFSLAGLNNNLGMSLLAQKKYAEAIPHFERANHLDPEQKQFENNHRFALLMLGDYSSALQNIADDQAGDILSDAGYIALQREEYVLARMLLEKSIGISPRYNERAARNLEKLEARHN